MAQRILITGSSIAGCTVAWWLGRSGFDVTVVEKASEFRDGGQNIDIRGAGRDVLRRMGMEADALARVTGEKGTAWINEDGEVVATFMADEMGADGPTAEMEILRGDLARLIYEGARDHAKFQFGDTISSAVESDEGVEVRFDSGKLVSFDLVIIAEGVGSTTRDLVFHGENDPRAMDMTMAYFTIPRTESDDQLWRWYHTTEGRGVSLRPDMHGTIRAMLSIQKEPEDESEWSSEQQKRWLRQKFAGAGWETERVLRGMDTTNDFYFDVLRQVRMPSWSRGRVVLTGDAAWCVTPLGGVGATLAVVGAYILAGELTQGDNIPSALSAYERRLREFVDKAQGIPKVVPRMANPHSRLGLLLLHGAVKLASVPGIKDLLAGLVTGKSDDIELPDYERLRAAHSNTSISR